MKRFRVGVPARLQAAIVASLGLMVVIAADRPALAAGVSDPLLRPTPLILKDGRIANVSVHVVPFAPGKAELAPEIVEQLADLTRTVGTDCFLTAQVIGHIESSEVAEDDTLKAHRLARSRADTVQASLIGSGLPAKAIASVWDWQFMVREARATLWVFQLTSGEDCEGTPLRPELVADGRPATPAAASPEPPAIVSAVAPAERATAPELATQPGRPAAATTAQAEAPRIAPARAETEPAVTAPPAEATVAALPGDAAPTPRPAPKPGAAKDQAASKDKSTSTGTANTSDAGTLVITFPTNSSYFPPDIPEQLQKLVAGLEGEQPHPVILQVAVSGSSHVVGANSAEEAARYNQWMAERRLERVEKWLLENLGKDRVVITPEYVANDDTRRVVVRLGGAG